MNKIDFSQYKFHASSVKNLMVKSRSKTDPLSETTKSFLQEIFIEEVFGRKKVISTPAMIKGTEVETETIKLLESATGKTYFKNNKELSNDFVVGTPDIADDKDCLIIDIKSSWDLWTFMKVDLKQASSDYYYQLLTYMWLKSFNKSTLFYGLVNTPDHLILNEVNRMAYTMEFDEAEKICRTNMTFDDLSDSLRSKSFDFEYCQDDVDQVINKIFLARDYLINLAALYYKN